MDSWGGGARLSVMIDIACYCLRRLQMQSAQVRQQMLGHVHDMLKLASGDLRYRMKQILPFIQMTTIKTTVAASQ